MKYPGQHHLFDMRYEGRTLTVTAVRRWARRIYIGYIDGKMVAQDPAKGALMRNLLPMARWWPKADPLFEQKLKPDALLARQYIRK